MKANVKSWTTVLGAVNMKVKITLFSRDFSYLAFPLAVEIVSHDVDVVQVLGDLWHVVARGNSLERRRDSGRQDQPGLVRRLCFALEGCSQLLD